MSASRHGDFQASLEELNRKIEKREAVVMTAQELCDLVRSGENIRFGDVDVVTCATKGIMSGTMVVLTVPVSGQKDFRKASSLHLNDVPCHVGPCPNEYLGMVDAVLFGTSHSISDPEHYGGGHVIRELVDGRQVDVRVETDDGRIIETDVTLDDLKYARMVGTRHAFRNYLAFTNPSGKAVNTIFSVLPFMPGYGEATFCGCGELNPLEKDPGFLAMGPGTPILLNGAIGTIIAEGTRSFPGKPNMLTSAPLKGMRPEYCGGFVTSAGPEVIASLAAAIPVLTPEMLEHLKRTDVDIPMKLTDVVGRGEISGTYRYGDVWHGNYEVRFRGDKCIHCPQCPVEEKCPTLAYSAEANELDRSLCFNCGACVNLCPHGTFECDLGNLPNRGDLPDHIDGIPVTLRQSDRPGANRLAGELRRMLENGEFKLALPARGLY